MAGNMRPDTASLIWATAFALPNLYWAANGTFGRQTIAADPDAALGWGAEPWALLLTGGAKIAAGVLALMAGHRRWAPIVLLAIVLGLGLLIYGIANLVQHAAVVTGILNAPESVGDTASRWHLLLWDPIWILGGLLFLATGWRARRESR
jgi:hypothetical protein